MKKTKLFVTTICAALLMSSSVPAVFAGREDVGTSAAAFLKIGAGARPAAMGEAHTAVSDDVNAIFYNPAGLAAVKGFEFTAQYGAHFQSIVYNVLGAAYPVENVGTFGLGVINLGVDKIERRAADTAIADGDFAAGDYAYVVSYSRKIAHRAAAGVNVKYLYSSIDNKTASATAADVGVIAEPLDSVPLSVGVSAQNMGGEMKFDAVGDPLPTVYKLGLGYRFPGDEFLLALDVAAPRDNASRISVGVEYARKIDRDFSAAARAGYKTVSDERLEGLAGLSAGAGVAFRQFKFDFAWLPYGLLGDTFRYALSVKF
ncbi:MAG: PorV/PorQ family protein [Endomicrobiia bacterium]|nr:PorV/PorQ family protein [Endomicrobiia bacterium]